MPNVGRTWVANRPLRLGDNDIRQPGELVPEAGDWPYKIRQIHVDLEWLVPIPLVSDADHAAVREQWQVEESAREAARAEAIASAELTPPEPEPAPPPEPPLTRYLCCNCREPYDFVEPPEETDRFQCGFCGQWQMVMQAKRYLLQLWGDPRSIPAYNHGPAVVNHARRSEDLTDAFKAMLGVGVPEERRANEDQPATPG